MIESDGPLAVTEPVITEVLAAARSDAQERDLRRLLTRFTLLSVESATDFAAAARIYRRCRATGITPRGLNDCLIAQVARRTDATLLAVDVDLERTASVIGVRMERVSR